MKFHFNISNTFQVGLMDLVSDSQSRDRRFEPHTGHNHDSSYGTSTGRFQEADSKVI